MIYLNILINNFCFILHWLLLDKTKKKKKHSKSSRTVVYLNNDSHGLHFLFHSMTKRRHIYT